MIQTEDGKRTILTSYGGQPQTIEEEEKEEREAAKEKRRELQTQKTGAPHHMIRRDTNESA